MKKWIFSIIGIILIIVIWQMLSVYQTAMSPVHDDKDSAAAIAMQKADVHTIDQVYTYNGTHSYTIVQGVDSKDEEQIVWVNGNNEIAFTASAKDGIPKEEVLNYLKTEKTPSKIISVSLGMEKDMPLWEIKYLDQNDRYNLYYIKFKNGEYFQRITF